MLDNTEEKIAKIAQVAYLYYVQGKTQQEVATMLGIARPIISRQLKEAEKLGIVHIDISYPVRSSRLEQEMISRFGLQVCRVHIIDSDDENEIKSLVARGAAKFFVEKLPSMRKIAVSWGSTLYEMIKQIEAQANPNLEIIQLIGATGQEHNPNDGPIIARNLAERLGAHLYPLHAPLVVESEHVAKALMKDKVIYQTLNRAIEADIAFVGIGSLEYKKNSLVKAGYLTEKELNEIRKAGAVGDICAQFYNIQGQILDIDINRRIIGLPIKKLQSGPTVIAASFGQDKVNGILGALRGRLINGLITDYETAEKIIENTKQTGTNENI